MALTMTVMIPRGPIARRILSAWLKLMLKNCFVTCSPKRVRRGARSLKRLFENSSPPNSSFGSVVLFAMAVDKEVHQDAKLNEERCANIL
jgi:hypothetical protein